MQCINMVCPSQFSTILEGPKPLGRCLLDPCWLDEEQQVNKDTRVVILTSQKKINKKFSIDPLNRDLSPNRTGK
jgi:hypothetical protein